MAGSAGSRAVLAGADGALARGASHARPTRRPGRTELAARARPWRGALPAVAALAGRGRTRTVLVAVAVALGLRRHRAAGRGLASRFGARSAARRARVRRRRRWSPRRSRRARGRRTGDRRRGDRRRLRAARDRRRRRRHGLSWLSPIGWAQAMRPFAGERWWPLALPLVVTAALVAVRLRAARATRPRRRARPRRGRGRAGRLAGARRPLGLALRLQRGALARLGAPACSLLGAGLRLVRPRRRRPARHERAGRGAPLRAGGASIDRLLPRDGALDPRAAGDRGSRSSPSCGCAVEETAGRAEPVLAAAAGPPALALLARRGRARGDDGSLLALGGAGDGTGRRRPRRGARAGAAARRAPPWPRRRRRGSSARSPCSASACPAAADRAGLGPARGWCCDRGHARRRSSACRTRWPTLSPFAHRAVGAGRRRSRSRRCWR